MQNSTLLIIISILAIIHVLASVFAYNEYIITDKEDADSFKIKTEIYKLVSAIICFLIFLAAITVYLSTDDD